MHRFFPSFGHRSRQNRDHRLDEYDDHDYSQQRSQRVPTTAWSRVVPNGNSKYAEHVNPDSSWDEDVFLERPESYTGHGAYPSASRRAGPSSSSSSSSNGTKYEEHHDNRHHRRPTVSHSHSPQSQSRRHDGEADADAVYLSDSTIAEEEYEYPDGRHPLNATISNTANTIPIVQRESSLTRLQESFAFADPGSGFGSGLGSGSARPVTELNIPSPSHAPSMAMATPVFQVPPNTSFQTSPHAAHPHPQPNATSTPISHFHAPPPPPPPSLPRTLSSDMYAPAPRAELRNVYPEQRLPTVVPVSRTGVASSQRADVFGYGYEYGYGDEYGYGYSSSGGSSRGKGKGKGRGGRYDEGGEHGYDGYEYGSEYGRDYQRRSGSRRDRERVYARDRDREYEPESILRERERHQREYREGHRPSQSSRVRRSSSTSSRSLSSSSLDDQDQEYPPCVVVVERGRHGKKDTYYVIPGGAPVIFEDAKGNELTRVGDFSGRYKPRRQRPVIIEDSHGREIGRIGFDDESSLDYPYRRNDTSYRRNDTSGSSEDEEGFYDRRGGDGGYAHGRSRSYRGDVSSSRHSSKQPSRDADQRYSPPRGRSPLSTATSNPNANVVYIPYTGTTRSRGSHSGNHSSGSSSTRHSRYRSQHNPDPDRPREYHEEVSRERQRVPYEPTRSSRSRDSESRASQRVVHLDHYGRQMSQSASSTGRRSHDSHNSSSDRDRRH